MNPPHDEAAALLWRHWMAGRKLAALPEALRPTDAAAGHAIQARLVAAGGRRMVGWKIAATSAVGQAHIGVSGPLAGRLLSGQVDADGATISLAGNGMRVAEPEFVFRFGADLPPRGQPYEVAQVLDAVSTLHLGLEVPDSRFEDFAHAGQAQLLADCACAHRFVLGPEAGVDWRALDLRRHVVHARVTRDGATRIARQGDGSAVLGDPRVALAWLVNDIAARGLAMSAGQLVTTGTCMAPLEIGPGDEVVADFGTLGQVSARFAA